MLISVRKTTSDNSPYYVFKHKFSACDDKKYPDIGCFSSLSSVH
jgi:hypothetical protein